MVPGRLYHTLTVGPNATLLVGHLVVHVVARGAEVVGALVGQVEGSAEVGQPGSIEVAEA